MKQTLQLLSLLIVSTYEVAQKKRSKYLAVWQKFHTFVAVTSHGDCLHVIDTTLSLFYKIIKYGTRFIRFDDYSSCSQYRV